MPDFPMTRTWNSLTRFLRDNGLLMMMAFALGCYVYGYDITHFSLSIDEENAALHGVALPYLTQGRWGISLLRTVLLPDTVLPFYAAVNTVILLSFASILAAHLLRLGSFVRFIFVALFMTFPQFAYIFQFSFLSESVALGICVGLGSVLLFRRFTDTRKPIFFAGSVALGIWCVGTYQSLIFIPVTMFLLLCLQTALHGPWDGKRFISSCLWFALYGVASLCGYVAVTAAVNAVFGTGLSEYITEFSAWKKQDVFRCLRDIFVQYWVIYTGNAYFGEKIFLTVWIPVLGLLVPRAAQSGPSSRPVRGLLLAAALIAPFSITLAMGHALPARIFVAEGLVFAGLWALWLEKARPYARSVVGALTIWAVLVNAGNVTQLFVSDTRVMEADILMANRLTQRIYDVCPQLDTQRVSVHLAGNHPAPLRKLRRSQTFGSSFFDMQPETVTRALTFMKIMGIADFKPALTLTLAQSAELARMPAWPDPQSVRQIDDVILVKFSQTP